jgi:hypothetical protein
VIKTLNENVKEGTTDLEIEPAPTMNKDNLDRDEVSSVMIELMNK